MRFFAAFAVLTGTVSATSNAAELPVWAYVFLTVVTSGIGGVALFWRVDRRIKAATADKTEGETAEVYQRVYGVMSRDVEAHLADMRTKLAESNATIQTLRADLAESNADRAQLRRDVRLLRDELATTRAQAGLDERRLP